jgi:hypothetical protein
MVVSVAVGFRNMSVSIAGGCRVISKSRKLIHTHTGREQQNFEVVAGNSKQH